MAKSDLLVGLDIGTTKVCVVVGEVTENGVDIVGIGSGPSIGLRKGVVVNIEQTIKSIKRALDEAELMADCNINSVYVGIVGSHIQGENNHGVIAVNGGEVTAKDVERVLDAAQAIVIGTDREILHVLPQEYIVDEQRGVIEPVGMAGVRLEANVHIITGAVTSAKNITKACQRSGLDVSGIVLEPLASSKATLRDEEKELGVILIDIGGGTTDISIFCNDSIRYTKVIDLGGQYVTTDIAMALRTPLVAAEEIKKQYSCALESLVGSDEVIEVPGVAGREGRKVSRQKLAYVCQCRMAEILGLAHQEILRSGLKQQVGAGVVLTGGGSLVEGLDKLAEEMFDMPVRIAGPDFRIGGLRDVVNSPIYSTAVGLLLYGAEKSNEAGHERYDSKDSIFTLMKKWFKNSI